MNIETVSRRYPRDSISRQYRYCINTLSVLVRCCIDMASIQYRFCTDTISISYRYCVDVTSISLQWHIQITLRLFQYRTDKDHNWDPGSYLGPWLQCSRLQGLIVHSAGPRELCIATCSGIFGIGNLFLNV